MVRISKIHVKDPHGNLLLLGLCAVLTARHGDRAYGLGASYLRGRFGKAWQRYGVRTQQAMLQAARLEWRAAANASDGL